ncbi:putative ankyrin repeat protein YahD [Cyphellophora attinorum]|uniref:Putative ankyrin repeat protein YahD n=1 Tax=Cyphellophora attinorum TaxID=1664694 RepID=A0A0N1HXX5_9EURO|nr:putative ankyrin repeat protein YahD [Phialophora attinorum]KPI43003.1 putative ankyrin repeat protein YahD [Phialophora attinorum]
MTAIKRIMDAKTQLLQAASNGDVEMVQAALDAGADIETRDSHQRTPLLLAASANHLDVARVLATAGASPNAQDTTLASAWLVTGVTGSVSMMRALLPAKPDLRLRNRYGGVSVIPASERGHVDYVRAVLEETDIDVNHVNNLHWTALLEAVILGDGGPKHQEIVKVLLEHGADRTIADKDGVTALQHAERLGYWSMVDILKS